MANIRIFDRAGYGFDMSNFNNGTFTVYTGGPSAQFVGSRWFDFDTYVLNYENPSSDTEFFVSFYVSDATGGSIIESIFYSDINYRSTVDFVGINLFVSNFDLNSGASEWSIRMFSGQDEITGNRYNEVIKSGASADVIRGNGGIDELYGESGNDRIFGGSGGDFLYGGSGNDMIAGGSEKDFYLGQQGNDVFRFDRASDAGNGRNADRILDFDLRYDYVDVSAIDANTRRPGNQDFSFIGTKQFSGLAGELRFKDEILSADTNGDRRADFQIVLEDVARLRDIDLYL